MRRLPARRRTPRRSLRRSANVCFDLLRKSTACPLSRGSAQNPEACRGGFQIRPRHTPLARYSLSRRQAGRAGLVRASKSCPHYPTSQSWFARWSPCGAARRLFVLDPLDRSASLAPKHVVACLISELGNDDHELHWLAAPSAAKLLSGSQNRTLATIHIDTHVRLLSDHVTMSGIQRFPVKRVRMSCGKKIEMLALF